MAIDVTLGVSLRYLIVSALVLLFQFGSSSIVLAEPTAEATVAAKSYVERLKGGEIKQAAMEYWDADGLLSGSFGLMYLELSPEERSRAQVAFAEFLAAPFSNERIANLFKSITVQDAKATQIDANRVSVRLELVGDGGRFKAVNTMLLERRGDAWKITDQRQGDQPSIRAALTMTFMGTARGPSDTIPVVLEKVAADTRKQMSGK